jgi:hypothetical protein
MQARKGASLNFPWISTGSRNGQNARPTLRPAGRLIEPLVIYQARPTTPWADPPSTGETAPLGAHRIRATSLGVSGSVFG